MPLRRRLWAILAAAYVTATAVTQLLWSGGASITAEVVGRAAAVIALQIGALEIAARLAGLYRRDDRADAVAGFLVLWFCLLLAFGVATLAFGLLIRQVDLTSVVVFSLLTVPSVQALAVMSTRGPAPSPGSGWRPFFRHPLTRPVLLLDGVMLALGVLLPNHALVGLAAVGLVQRRWVGTKLIAAALILGGVAMRRSTRTPLARSLPGFALAAALAALGIDTFVPWLFGMTSSLPSPLSAQPPSIIWLEVYGMTAALVLTLTILVRHALGDRSIAARSLLGYGAIALFVATLALLMNGFLSLDPVFPWGAIVVTAASAGASCYAGGALLMSSGQRAAGSRPPGD